jgi:serine/threonine-protein kinase
VSTQEGSDDIPVAVGDVLAGKYRVERILGAGGMGVVVAARHIELNELRALKFLLPDSQSNEDTVERFLREARAMVKLRSPHVVQVHDIGRFDTGEPYMVMEYLEGEDLQAVLDAGRDLPVSDCVDIILQGLVAMAEAHAAGIVHRDLKPANMYVTRDRDGAICVKVLDFGISKLLRDGDDMKMTSTQALMGSPYYMSPEQMMSTRDVDERADIWSIGVVLYELLTGRVPFRGKNIAAQCALLLQKTPLPPSERAPRPLPAGLDAVVLQFLEREPEDRFQTTVAAAEALAPYGGPLAQRARGSIQRALRDSLPSWSGGKSGDISLSATVPSELNVPPAVRKALEDSQRFMREATISNEPTAVGSPLDATPSSSGSGAASITLPSATFVGPAVPSAATPAQDLAAGTTELEAAPHEAMSQSTKASWQTMSQQRPTRGYKRGLWLGLGAALLVASGLGFIFIGGDDAAPASAGDDQSAATPHPVTEASTEPTSDGSHRDPQASSDATTPEPLPPASTAPRPKLAPTAPKPVARPLASPAAPKPASQKPVAPKPAPPQPPTAQPPPAVDPFGTGRK